MAIDVEAVRSWQFPVVTQRYDERDAIIYALGLGVGQDPVDPVQLQFVYEKGLRVLPSMSVVLGFPGPWLSDPATGVDYSRVVHGEQHLQAMRPLLTAGTVECMNRVVDVVDRGAGKGTAVTIAREVRDSADGQLIARHTSVLIARGDGGFGVAPAGAATPRLASPPARDADQRFDWQVPPQLALIYRLSGDKNPLHADIEASRRAGFDRPILHGLASFGIAGFAAIAALCGGDPNRLSEIGVRFASPILPGDTLAFEFWHGAPGEAAFRARSVERDRVVLDYGRVCHAG